MADEGVRVLEPARIVAGDTISFGGGTTASVKRIIGGLSSADKITGPSPAVSPTVTWNITGANAGKAGGIEFEKIENLVGGTVDDTFVMHPGGSISGAPKLRSMEVIAALEREGRGHAYGSLVALDVDGRLRANLLIRTLFWRARPERGSCTSPRTAGTPPIASRR